MADLLGYGQNMLVLALLGKLIEESRKEGQDAGAGLPAGLNVPVELCGAKAGTLNVPRASTTVKVADLDALMAWVRANHPEQIIRRPEIAGAFLDQLKAKMKKHGGWLHAATGEVEAIPGLELCEGAGSGTPRVTLEIGSGQPVRESVAYALVAEAHRRGLVNLGQVLALEAPGEQE